MVVAQNDIHGVYKWFGQTYNFKRVDRANNVYIHVFLGVEI